MAIAIISSINKTANGTITVPAGCTLIVALVKGTVTSPKIAGVNMASIAEVPATGVIPAISIHQYTTPAIATLAFTFVGVNVHFIFLSGADSYRPGAVFGYTSGGVYTGSLVTTTADLVFGILCGSIGPTTLKGDTVAMTYLVNDAMNKVGYITPGDTLLTSEAADTGTSAGYWIDNGFLHHDAVLLTTGYWDYPAVWHEGYSTDVWIQPPGYWELYNEWVPHLVWYPSPYPGFWVGGNVLKSRWITPAGYWGNVWHDGWYTYDGVWHAPTYQAAYDEELADTWVAAGTSQISACFCSIKTTPGGQFISRPNMFG